MDESEIGKGNLVTLNFQLSEPLGTTNKFLWLLLWVKNRPFNMICNWSAMTP